MSLPRFISSLSATLTALAAVLALSLSSTPARAQSVSVGADVVSRYVWRGVDFGESLSIQPALSFGYSGFEIGAWGSYSVSADGADANENDLWASLTLAGPSGSSVTATVTDYYFPGPGATGFSYSDAHTLEVALSVTGPEALPVTLYGGMLVRNDPDDSIYLEASVPITLIGDADVGLVAGMVTGTSDFYGTDGASVVNLGINASRDLEISDSFAIPLSAAWIYNPEQDRAYLVMGMSLSP